MNRTRMALSLATLAVGLAEPTFAQSQERWLADLRVEMTVTEDAAAGTLTHQIVVTNQGDDAARDVVITHVPVLGTAIHTYRANGSTCGPIRVYNPGVSSIQCTRPVLAVGASETMVVITSNRTTFRGRHVTTAQAMGASPDGRGCDNVFEVDLP